MLYYWDPYKKASLEIEVYNTGEIAGLVNREKTIVECRDIESDKDLDKLVKLFKRH